MPGRAALPVPVLLPLQVSAAPRLTTPTGGRGEDARSFHRLPEPSKVMSWTPPRAHNRPSRGYALSSTKEGKGLSQGLTLGPKIYSLCCKVQAQLASAPREENVFSSGPALHVLGLSPRFERAFTSSALSALYPSR